MSIAKRLLQTIKEDDAAAGKALLSDPTPGPGATPSDKGAAPAADQPADNATGQPDLQKMVEMMDDPEKMSCALEAMSAQCDKYMDESDDTTYTCKDMQEKEDVELAAQAMKEACMKLKGKKSSS